MAHLLEAGQRDHRSSSQSAVLERHTHISPCSIALDSLHCLHLGVYKDYCMTVLVKCILADARADVGVTLQGATASVVPNAKFTTSVDPSKQTSGPEAVDAGQSSAPIARHKGSEDGDSIGFCHGPREAARCMPGCRGTCAGFGGCALWQASVAHPSGTSCCTSVPELASREIHISTPRSWTKTGTAEWRSWQQDAIA